MFASFTLLPRIIDWHSDILLSLIITRATGSEHPHPSTLGACFCFYSMDFKLTRPDFATSVQDALRLDTLYDKLESGPILAVAGASNNTAEGNAVQVCAPVVGGSLQYLYVQPPRSAQ